MKPGRESHAAHGLGVGQAWFKPKVWIWNPNNFVWLEPEIWFQFHIPSLLYSGQASCIYKQVFFIGVLEIENRDPRKKIIIGSIESEKSGP